MYQRCRYGSKRSLRIPRKVCACSTRSSRSMARSVSNWMDSLANKNMKPFSRMSTLCHMSKLRRSSEESQMLPTILLSMGRHQRTHRNMKSSSTRNSLSSEHVLFSSSTLSNASKDGCQLMIKMNTPEEFSRQPETSIL